MKKDENCTSIRAEISLALLIPNHFVLDDCPRELWHKMFWYLKHCCYLFTLVMKCNGSYRTEVFELNLQTTRTFWHRDKDTTSFEKHLESSLGYTLSFYLNLVKYRWKNIFLNESLPRSPRWSSLKTEKGPRRGEFRFVGLENSKTRSTLKKIQLSTRRW